MTAPRWLHLLRSRTRLSLVDCTWLQSKRAGRHTRANDCYSGGAGRRPTGPTKLRRQSPPDLVGALLRSNPESRRNSRTVFWRCVGRSKEFLKANNPRLNFFAKKPVYFQAKPAKPFSIYSSSTSKPSKPKSSRIP
jgi:hypothetical protein